MNSSPTDIAAPPQLPVRSARRLPVYNPHIQTDAEVIASFVARRKLFARVMDDLRSEPAQGRAQPHLIIGTRGMGKTTLLMRLAAELRRPEFAGRFVPLVFAEEQYSVDRLSKFWLNCLDSLADAWQKRGETGRLAEIDTSVARCETQARGVARDQDAPLATRVLDELLRLAGAERPVLLVDNIQLMFERLPVVQQHALREVLMRAGGPVLIAASPHPVLETQDYGAPFYDLFKTHWLSPLSVEEMRELLVELAKMQGRGDIATRIAAQPGRLQTLHLLTGGNPRAAVLLFHLYAEGLSSNVYADLEGVLDLVTPLYKARFEELAPQMQVVAAALAEEWDPCTARQLADLTSLPITQISPQLHRLEKLGFIESVALARGDQGWQIAERLFNLWFLMRLASRRQARSLELLTFFLESWFSSEEEVANQGGTDLAAWDQNAAVDLSPVEADLQQALCMAQKANWGEAQTLLGSALDLPAQNFTRPSLDDWMRASAVLIHLGFGTRMLEFLEQRGENLRRRPWFEAVRASEANQPELLKNVAPEVRLPAEQLLTQIQQRLARLPEATRKRPVISKPGGRRKRK